MSLDDLLNEFARIGGATSSDLDIEHYLHTFRQARSQLHKDSSEYQRLRAIIEELDDESTARDLGGERLDARHESISTSRTLVSVGAQSGGLVSEATRAESVAPASGNLPPEPNSFVGRERELAELARMVGDVRALTLCGPGGIGKTRLALRLACELVPDYPDGAWLVELADTADPGLVAWRVAATLGVRGEPDLPLAETLTETLRARQLLLILDTCEHVVGACAGLVQQLLTGCAGLCVIATSREPLRVRGETVWRVPPLTLPGSRDGSRRSRREAALPGSLDDPPWARHEAVRLFAERASAARSGFALAADNAEAVARLCRTLDGMPLAIELAAARIRALSVEQIADRLGDRFQLLASGDRTAPPRQQTLRAAVDWSYELLTAPEQILLRRLSVFAGWTLEMAEGICADEQIPAGLVFDLMANLIDKSLVTFELEASGDSRYRLLDTIKEYASGRLAASGEEATLRVRHRDFLLDFGEGVVAQAFVRGDPPWPQRVALYRRIAMERANYRLALRTSLERGDAGEGLRICSAMRNPWVTYGDVSEGTEWFDLFLALPGEVPDAVRGRALVHRGDLAFEQEDYPTASHCAQQGLDLCRRSGDPHEAEGLRLLAVLSLRMGHYEEALATLEQAMSTARAVRNDWEVGLALSIKAAVHSRQGRLREAQWNLEAALEVLRDNNGWGVAQVLYGLGGLATARGDHAAALRYFDEALGLYRAIDARPGAARCLAGIGLVALAQGDLDLSASSLTESLQLSLATGQRRLTVARGLEAFAALAAKADDPSRAVRLVGAALEVRAAVGQVPAAGDDARLEDLLEPAVRRLGEEMTAGLLAEGRAMTADEAVGYAMSAGSEGQPLSRSAGLPIRTLATAVGGPGASAPSVLTLREWEIAAMIARGLTNQQISDKLVISRATVARHVANILTKLGFSSRAQVAAWMVGREPDTPGGEGQPLSRSAGLPIRTLATVVGGPGASAPSVLTPREWEIAAMIARGLTNQQISDKLVISRATVARHVANILTKLGFTSRAQVAAWMAGRGPGTPG